MIYLNESSYQLLQKRAQQVGQSLSHLIRTAVDYYLSKSNKSNTFDEDPLWQLAGLAKATHKNRDSIKHDQLLYGKNRKK